MIDFGPPPKLWVPPPAFAGAGSPAIIRAASLRELERAWRGRWVVAAEASQATFPFPIVAPGGTWQTAAAATLNATDSGWNATYTRVQRITGGTFLVTGNLVRLTFEAAAGNGLPLTAVYIGLRAGAGDPYDFAATPTQLTFGGSGATTIAAGQSVVTDPASFTINGTTDVLIAFSHTPPGGAHDLRARTTQSGWSHYYKNGVSEAATVDKSSYIDYTATRNAMCISKLEIFV